MKTVIAVLRGGPSREYDVSLQSGGAVIKALETKGHLAPRDIFIDKQGQWHRSGVPVSPTDALSGADVAFNALHGEYGEDGMVQRVLDTLGVPYTGSGAYASATAFNKDVTRRMAGNLGLRIAKGRVVRRSDIADDHERFALNLFRSFPMPAIIKPLSGGSSVGIVRATHFDALRDGLRGALEHSPSVLIEEYVRGREATVGVVDGFRNERLYALPPVEIIPPNSSVFFDYDAKYSGKSTERCPGNFSEDEKRALMDAARRIHEGLGLAHYSRSDFIVTKRGIYFLEVNTLPGLTDESLLPKSLAAVGASLPDFIEHVITLARKHKR